MRILAVAVWGLCVSVTLALLGLAIYLAYFTVKPPDVGPLVRGSVIFLIISLAATDWMHSIFEDTEKPKVKPDGNPR